METNEQEPPAIDSYLAVPYFRDEFLEAWDLQSQHYIAEIRITATVECGTVAKASVLADPEGDSQTTENTFLRLEADRESLQKLHDYLISDQGRDTTLLYVVLGMTKDPIEHILGIVPQENFSQFFVLNKGMRVAKGGKVAIQDPKNGKVTITVG